MLDLGSPKGDQHSLPREAFPAFSSRSNENISRSTVLNLNGGNTIPLGLFLSYLSYSQ